MNSIMTNNNVDETVNSLEETNWQNLIQKKMRNRIPLDLLMQLTRKLQAQVSLVANSAKH